MRLGLIGTGNMGSRIGPKLLQAGHSLTVYDIRRDWPRRSPRRAGLLASTRSTRL